MATFATEFLAVQYALGIKLKGFSNADFKASDEANAKRISTIDQDGVYAVWVDKKLVVTKVGEQRLQCTKMVEDLLFAAFGTPPTL